MRRLALFAALLLVGFAPTARAAAEPAPLRTALLGWEAVPARPDVQRVAADLVALAQVELSSEPGLAWVERAELDKLLAEADLAASGRLDPRASLRVGKLARAQLLVTGRLDASDFVKTTLALDAIDLEHGDLLASSSVPLPPRPHKHYALRDEDRVAAVAALRPLLAEAAARQRELGVKPALALLFLANSGPSSRLDSAGERLAESLRDSAASAGARVLRFPRARDSEDENDLAVLGLAEADDQAWRGVADLYVWGEYKEIPADGLAFEQTPVEASLTLWDGASAPRTIPWRGTVATFPEAAAIFSTTLQTALRKTAVTDPAARSTAAKLLADQTAALAKLNAIQMNNRAFWESELGRNFQNHEVRLLETALFLDPAAFAPRKALCDIRWHPLSAPKDGFSVEQLWNRYDELVALAGRRSPPRPDFPGGIDAEIRIQLLQDIINAHGSRLRGEGRLAYPRILRAAELWTQEIKTHASTLAAQPGFRPKDLEWFGDSRLRALAGDGPIGQPEIDATVVGDRVLHRMIEGAWPALAPAFAAQFKEDPDTAMVSASRIIEVFRSVGQEDIAYGRLSAAVAGSKLGPAAAAGNPSPHDAALPIDTETVLETAKALLDSLPVKLVQTGARSGSGGGKTTFSTDLRAPFGTSTADCERLGAEFKALLLSKIPGLSEVAIRVTPDPRAPPALSEFGVPPDPRPVAPGWKSRDADPVSVSAPTPDAKSDLDRALPLTARPLHVWFYAGDFASDLWNRSYKQWPLNHLTAPDFTRLLGFDGDHLWIDGLPVEGALGDEAAPYRVTAYSPYSHTFTGMASRLPPGSRRFAGQFTPELGFLASEFDGLLKLGPEPGVVQRITTDQGLPSLKLSALARFENGIAVAAAPPERTAAYLEFATGQWRALRPPPAPASQTRAGTPSREPGATPVLAGAGRWLLYADARPVLFDTAAQRWSDALAAHQAKRAALHDRVREESLRRFRAASESSDTAALASLAPRLRGFPDWALDAPSAVVADDKMFWLGGPSGLTRLDPESPAAATTEKCPPILALADTGPWLWVAFSPADDAMPKRPGFPSSFAGKPARPHAVPYPTDDPPEWRRSRLALYDKATRRWLGSLEVEGGIVSLAAAPGRLWAAGSDLYEFDTAVLLTPDSTSAPAPASGFTARWAGLPPHALHRAAALHDKASLDRILAASPSAALDRTVSGWTPLHVAAAAGNPYAVAALLAADPAAAKKAANALSVEGVSPLALAAGAGDLASLRLLLEAGADPSAKTDTPATASTNPPPASSPPAARLYATSPARFSPSPLHLAAAAGRDAAISALLDAGADPASRDLGGYTPHHAALLAGHTVAARVLLTRNAPLNATVPAPVNSVPGVATIHAFQRPFHPALPGERPVRGAGTALSLLYEGRTDRDLFETILAAGADPLLGPDGPLAVRAAYLGRAEDAERFLALAPHPFVTDIYDRTAFVAALAAKRFGLARVLRERCFAPGDPRWPAAKSLRLNETALKLAVELGDHEMLGWLIARGATVPFPYGWDDLLEIAVEKGRVDCVGQLVSAGARPHSLPSQLREKIRDPLLIAALETKTKPKGPLLVAAPAPAPAAPKAPPATRPAPAPSTQGPAGFPFPRRLYSPQALYSPRPDNVWITSPRTGAAGLAEQDLLAAAARGDRSAVEAALAKGAHVDATDDKKWTPLIHAINGGHLEVARLLLDRGASLNRLTAYGSTPLGFATDSGRLDFIGELLDLGADPNLVDPDLPGPSPLAAKMNKNPEVARLLLSRGADPRAIVNSHGRGGALPAVFLAAARGDLATVKMLVEAGAEPAAILWRDGFSVDRARGQNALHSAAASNDLVTLDYFLSLGLDPAQGDAYGDNALDMALLSNADRTAAKLRALGVKTRAERGLPPRED